VSNTGEVIIYRDEGGQVQLDVRLEHETVWLTQQQLAELFGTTRENITIHLGNIFDEGELDRAATSKDFLQVRQEGARTVRRTVAHCNLDATISVGYRVKSAIATRFRIWATGVLREHLVAGYTVNEQRLTQIGKVLEILQRADDELVSGVADLLARFTDELDLLDRFDHQSLELDPASNVQ
jgi:hypothetical protein